VRLLLRALGPITVAANIGVLVRSLGTVLCWLLLPTKLAGYDRMYKDTSNTLQACMLQVMLCPLFPSPLYSKVQQL
jgi:hypothetical protein